MNIAILEKKAKNHFGCSLVEMKAIQLILGDDPTRNYSYFKHTKNEAGIPFSLTYKQWADLWIESGKFHLIGNKKESYQMTRIDNTKPFEKGNVIIVPLSKVKRGQKRKS